MQSSTNELYRINENHIFRVYPQRFWILFVFTFLSFNQCMFWLTFSPIASSAKIFFHIDEATIDLLLNWGPIIFLPTLPIIYLILNTHHGLRKCVLIYAIVSLIATIIRVIPSVVISSSHPSFHDITVPFLHIGQILIAATGPIGMALVSQLSCLWFAPHERTRATTIAILGSSLGGAIAFLISPHLVFESQRVPYLLYLHTGQALLACICTLVYFPGEPPSLPSSAAHLLTANRFQTEPLLSTLKRFLSDILHCCQDISCVLLILEGVTIGGTLSAWGGLFATILEPLGYSETQAGWFGFGQSVAGILGALITGQLADLPRFQRSFKTLLLISLILFEHFFWPNDPPIPSNVFSIGILLSLNGFFSGAGSPLTYECLAEMMHPLPESLTASIYAQLFNVTSLIFLAIAPNRYILMNLLVLLMMIIGILMIICVKVTYKRKDEEQSYV
ncbi:hypothetical protein I4U23_027899 [Adineta vaga]|nr:hypothetical protein I4U23_027899 [Adineta vaga]